MLRFIVWLLFLVELSEGSSGSFLPVSEAFRGAAQCWEKVLLLQTVTSQSHHTPSSSSGETRRWLRSNKDFNQRSLSALKPSMSGGHKGSKAKCSKDTAPQKNNPAKSSGISATCGIQTTWLRLANCLLCGQYSQRLNPCTIQFITLQYGSEVWDSVVKCRPMILSALLINELKYIWT